MASSGQMKAQVLEAYNKPYAFTTVPVPQTSNENDLIIKVEAAGYCHTDAVLAAGQMQYGRQLLPFNFPHIGSHEFAGTVVSLPDSPSTIAKQFSVGTRVGVPGRGFHSCGNCYECQDPKNDLSGYSFFCPDQRTNGLGKDGGFAEYCLVDARQVAPLPDDLSAVDAAPLMCAGVTIYNALKKCNLTAGQRVGIVGCGGGLGHLGLQFADAMGLRVTGVDAADGPLELARSLNTKAHIVDARSDSAKDIVEQIGKEDGKVQKGDMGLDAVIILPEGQSGFDFGVQLLRDHSLCMVVSFPENGFQVSARDIVFRDITVKGTILGTNSTIREMLAFAAKHGVKTVMKTFNLESLNELVDEYNKGGGGKLVVDMAL